MKRDIISRGKRIDNGKWVYGDLIIDRSTQIFRIIADGALVKHGDHTNDGLHYFSGHIYDVDKSTVGQFTGLKDKNGVEVYEGDIVRFCDAPPYCYNCTVKYDDERLIWIADEVGNFMEDLWEFEWEFAEVVGNIHDDLSLLNSDKGD